MGLVKHVAKEFFKEIDDKSREFFEFVLPPIDLHEENVNLIVSGGISNIDDVIKVKELDPFGVILGKALYENQVTIEEAKEIWL